jgi:hypothetical protein
MPGAAAGATFRLRCRHRRCTARRHGSSPRASPGTRRRARTSLRFTEPLERAPARGPRSRAAPSPAARCPPSPDRDRRLDGTGLTALTRISSPASSRPTKRVRARTAAVAGAIHRHVREHGWSRRCGEVHDRAFRAPQERRACRVVSMTPATFSVQVRRVCSGDAAASGATSKMPALLTRRSSRSKRARGPRRGLAPQIARAADVRDE